MDEETEEIENNERVLRQERATNKDAAGAEEMSQEAQDELAATAHNKNKSVVFLLSILLKGLSDFADWFGLPALPLVGDILDLATGGVSIFSYLSLSGVARKKGIIRSIGALVFELLPFGINDLVPTYVIEGIWTRFTTMKLANQAEEQLEEIKKKE
ncbi:MAG: hypothetical protein AAB630_02255 [Patescibacteria group bacterium]